MKAILISIKPKWVAKILNGEKTIEIRKTMPKCDLPVDVYIYCTKEEDIVYFGYGWGNIECLDTKKQIELMREWKLGNYNDITWWINKKDNKRVVAKFTLNKVDELVKAERVNIEILNRSCLEAYEFFEYLLNKKSVDKIMGYAWHISNLKIFDEPKELSEFRHRKQFMPSGYMIDPLTKAPQSFMYVEVE